LEAEKESRDNFQHKKFKKVPAPGLGDILLASSASQGGGRRQIKNNFHASEQVGKAIQGKGANAKSES